MRQNICILCSGIVGVIVGAILHHYLTICRDSKNRRIENFNEAATEFTKIFNPILEKLRSPIQGPSVLDVYDIGNNVYGILKSTFSSQYYAITNFRKAINNIRKLTAFTEAWEKYYYPQDIYNQEDNFYFFGNYLSNADEEEIELRKKAIEHIENLLRFAELK